jgi:hypothetical protein
MQLKNSNAARFSWLWICFIIVVKWYEIQQTGIEDSETNQRIRISSTPAPKPMFSGQSLKKLYLSDIPYPTAFFTSVYLTGQNLRHSKRSYTPKNCTYSTEWMLAKLISCSSI